MRDRSPLHDDATFSPHGLFVAVARGGMLAAVDPLGRVRWTLTRPAPVSRPAWSPDGFRVAYRSGSQLRVVYGDGALDRALARRSAPVTPAWRPGPGHRLAAVAPGRRSVLLRNTDSGGILWRAAASGRVIELAWSPHGRRLLIVTPAEVTILDGDGHTQRTLRAPAGERIRRASWLPDGRAFAIVRGEPAGTKSEVVLAAAGRRGLGAAAAKARAGALLAVPTRLDDVVVSPDGRWLLLSAPADRQWLLLPTSRPGRLIALSHVGRQFDPGGRGQAPLPRVDDWLP